MMAEMQHVIFYSWQSDLPNATNRGFIQQALEAAAAMLARDLDIEPVIDRDTLNVPGAPDIAQAIFTKIAAADVFAADVSFINEGSAKRRTPNPNVLVEVGYALRALGPDRIVLIFNRAFGRPEDLPFDLRMRRTVAYDMPEALSERSPARKQLATALTTGIKSALEAASAKPPAPGPIEMAVASVENAEPKRALLLRRAMDHVVRDLEVVAPAKFSEKGTAEDLVSALHETVPAISRFAQLAKTVAALGDTEGAEALFDSMRALFERYNSPQSFTGNYDARDFDYWKFLGHEVLTSIVAFLLLERRHDVIGAILDREIVIPNPRGRQTTKSVTFGYASESLESLRPIARERRRVSYHADLLRDRHTPGGPLADLLGFDDFLAADYFLFLRGELEPASPPQTFFEWLPWSSVYLSAPNTTIRSALRMSTA